jgi:hypothetical protein
MGSIAARVRCADLCYAAPRTSRITVSATHSGQQGNGQQGNEKEGLRSACAAQITNDPRHLGYAASCAMTSMGKVN